ncbi:unnamed protein product, partial [Bubo scandiacus]
SAACGSSSWGCLHVVRSLFCSVLWKDGDACVHMSEREAANPIFLQYWIQLLASSSLVCCVGYTQKTWGHQ